MRVTIVSKIPIKILPLALMKATFHLNYKLIGDPLKIPRRAACHFLRLKARVFERHPLMKLLAREMADQVVPPTVEA